MKENHLCLTKKDEALLIGTNIKAVFSFVFFGLDVQHFYMREEVNYSIHF